MQLMYAVGHFALGYLTGKIASKSLNVDVNLPLLFLASVFPDVDIVIPFLEHRGPLHSVVVLSVLFLPLFLLYKKRAVPYFVAVIQHSIIGDFLTGGTQLFWPVSFSLYGLGIGIQSLTNITLEWVFFVISIAVMFKAKDLSALFKPKPSNLILVIPLMTVLLPSLITFPLYVPWALLIPHLVYLFVFVFSIFVTLKAIVTRK
jgi:membrane-bound metal-dependent hydrolase YbcI (DUF457 family)